MSGVEGSVASGVNFSYIHTFKSAKNSKNYHCSQFFGGIGIGIVSEKISTAYMPVLKIGFRFQSDQWLF